MLSRRPAHRNLPVISSARSCAVSFRSPSLSCAASQVRAWFRRRRGARRRGKLPCSGSSSGWGVRSSASSGSPRRESRWSRRWRSSTSAGSPRESKRGRSPFRGGASPSGSTSRGPCARAPVLVYFHGGGASSARSRRTTASVECSRGNRRNSRIGRVSPRTGAQVPRWGRGRARRHALGDRPLRDVRRKPRRGRGRRRQRGGEPGRGRRSRHTGRRRSPDASNSWCTRRWTSPLEPSHRLFHEGYMLTDEEHGLVRRQYVTTSERRSTRAPHRSSRPISAGSLRRSSSRRGSIRCGTRGAPMPRR